MLLTDPSHRRAAGDASRLLVGAVMGLCLVTANGALPFAAPVRLAESGGAIATVAADLNGDGRAEFISAASKDSSGPHFRIYSYLPASRTFTNYTILDAAALALRQDRFGGDLAVGDINRDGFPDIIVPESDNGDGPGRVSWFENPQGDLGGVWVEHVISVWTGAPGDSVAHMAEVAVGDVDGNGWPDVVTRDVSHGCYVLFQNNTGTGWHPRRFLPANPREGLALWNPDGDGDLDILINGLWLETPADALNGTYIPHLIAAPWYPAFDNGSSVNDYACKVASADFNGDGRPDVIITNAEELEHAPGNASKPDGVRLYLAPTNLLTGTWTEVVLTNQHFSWHTLEIADVDRDGDLDVVTGLSLVGVDVAPGRVMTFLNNGTGTNFTAVTVDAGLDAQGLPVNLYNATLGDADGDGDKDLFAPDDWASGPLRYYENLTVPVSSNPPAGPVNLSASPLSATLVELTWNAGFSNVGGFKIERRDAAEDDFTQVGQTPAGARAFTDPGLAPEAEYVYRVRAFNLFGDSEQSNEAMVGTPPDVYSAWRLANFGEDPDPSLADGRQDPDFDSVPNLLEYFHGTDPNAHDNASPVTISANGRLRIAFTRNPQATDLNLTVQAAYAPTGPWTDLARSTGGGAFTALVPGAEVSEVVQGALRRVSVGDMYPLADPARPRRFLRLRLDH